MKLTDEHHFNVFDEVNELFVRLDHDGKLTRILTDKIRAHHDPISDEELEDDVMDSQISLVYELTDVITKTINNFSLYND